MKTKDPHEFMPGDLVKMIGVEGVYHVEKVICIAGTKCLILSGFPNAYVAEKFEFYGRFSDEEES